MDREKKRVQIIHKTDSPYSAPQWPPVSRAVQETILDLLCNFLSPVGQHRENHVNRSKGKRLRRQKRKRDKESGNGAAESVYPVPDVINYTVIGFNSTVQLLQHLARSTSPVTSATGTRGKGNCTKKMAAVFVCTSTLPALLTSSIPMLVAAASACQPSDLPIRLVSLPRGAEKRLADVLFQPRVGFVGVLQDAPGGTALIHMATDKISPVHIHCLRSDAQVEYMPVSVKTTLFPARNEEPAK